MDRRTVEVEEAVGVRSSCLKTPRLLKRLPYQRRPSVTYRPRISSEQFGWSRLCDRHFRTRTTGGRGTGGLWLWPLPSRTVFMLFVWWIPSRNPTSVENGRTLLWWRRSRRSVRLIWLAKPCGGVGCRSTVSIWLLKWLNGCATLKTGSSAAKAPLLLEIFPNSYWVQFLN